MLSTHLPQLGFCYMSKKCALMLTVVALSTLVFDIHAANAAPRDVGGLNLAGYCDYKYDVTSPKVYGDGWLILKENQRNAYGWRCVSFTAIAFPGTTNVAQSIHEYDIDTNAVCRWQYPQVRGVYAQTLHWQDPYSWRCVAN